MVSGPTHKIGNNASKLAIFLWSKIIKTIWICRQLLEQSKPCNEMHWRRKRGVGVGGQGGHFVDGGGNDMCVLPPPPTHTHF